MIKRLDEPNERQKEFLLAETRYVGYGGSRGGGKSWAVRAKAMLLGANYAGIRMLLLRRTYPELKENHIIPLQELLNCNSVNKGDRVATYKETDKAFTFVNGSRLKLGYLDSDSDVLQYQGQEYDIIFLDEATHFTEFMFNTLKACLRGANTFPKRMYLTCNPGGVGHEWVKRLFIDKHYKQGENKEDYTFIRASVYDNKVLMTKDPGYVEMLETLPKGLKEAWLFGNWDVFEGQYFPEWNYDIHTCEPFPIPSNWTRKTAMDYGLDMFAHYHIAEDEKGEAYVWREIYQSGVVVSDAAQMVKDIEKGESEEYVKRIAPPDLWNTQSISGTSTAHMFMQNGLNLTRANNDRIDGWLALKELMKVYTDDKGVKRSKLHIFRNCVNLIRCIPLAQYDDKNPCDVANQPHEITHSLDALRYYAISHRSKANPLPGNKPKLVEWTEDQWEDYNNADSKLRAIMIKMWGEPKR